ncbi:MAG TPA: hypothetical protein VJ740_03345, partial [Hyphomicrobiaceae bacterium]|nr:hypothetical protein [Hyphomicrobiaceae bacterium]
MPTNDMTARSPMRARLAEEVSQSAPRLIEMTQALVKVASPNPPSDTAEVAAVAERLLADIPGVEVRRVEPESGIVNLVARIRSGAPGRRLIFNGHLDTFPLGDAAGWSVPPLGGGCDLGRVARGIGRGDPDERLRHLDEARRAALDLLRQP